MATFPKLSKIQAHLRAHNTAAAVPVRPRALSAKPIPINGAGATSINAETLARVYDSSNTYNDPGTAFGPGTPPRVQPLDNTGRPRRDYYQPGHNLMGIGLVRRIDPVVTQNLVDSYDLFRKALYVRIDELACLSWDIAPDPLLIRTVREKRDIQDRDRDKIIAARQFFKKPDRQNVFNVWLRNVLEDHFIFDAIAIHKRRTRGGALYSLPFIDGSLIKPLVNESGANPEPPAVAYQQYILGVPRFDFTFDELIYRPKHVRARSLIGFSVVEQFILHINTALRFQAWNTAFFTDGNIPSRLLTAPENWTADKIEEWQLLWDAILAGDPTAQRKLFMVPPGVEEIGGGNDGQFDYATEFSKYLIDITCVATDVTRQELGLEPGNSEGLGGSGLHDAMANTQNHRLVRTATFLADAIFTPLLQEEFGLDNFVWTWPALEKQDAKAHAELVQLQLFSGQKSFDEILMDDGQEPVGVGRFINLSGKLIFEKDLLQMQEEGTLAFEQKTAEQQGQTEVANQKEIAEHATGQQQQVAEHAAGLQQQVAEHATGQQQQLAEHAASLQSDQAMQQQEFGQQNAEQGASLQQQTAEHASGLQAEQMQQQAGIAQQAQTQQAQTQQEAGIAQQQTQQEAGVAQQQAQQDAGIAQQQGQQDAGFAQQAAQQQAGVDQQTAQQAAQVQGQQMQQQAGIDQQQAAQGAQDQQDQAAQQGDMDLQGARQQASLDSEQLQQQAEIAAEQSDRTHAQALEQDTAASRANQETAELAYRAKTGKKPPESGLAAMPGSAPVGQPLGHGHPTDFDPNNDSRSPRGFEDPLLDVLKVAVNDLHATATEMDQWRRKLEKGLKAGKPLSKINFQTNFIHPDSAIAIRESLSGLVLPTPQEIRRVFKAAMPDVVPTTLA